MLNREEIKEKNRIRTVVARTADKLGFGVSSNFGVNFMAKKKKKRNK